MIIFGAVVFGILMILILIKTSGKSDTKEATFEKKLMAFAGKTEPKFVHVEDNTGISLNYSESTLMLACGNFFKTYSFDDIREWRVSKVTPAETMHAPGGGVAVALSVMAVNRREERQAEAESGLYMRMKDIDNPVWRISMYDKNAQDRWMEILTQKVNRN